MGPQPSSRGNQFVAELLGGVPRVLHASMGPQPSSRGNLRLPGQTADIASYIQSLQWGRNLPVAEITVYCRGSSLPDYPPCRFNGAATFQSRKYCSGRFRPPSRRSCFNGAATFQSRKLTLTRFAGNPDFGATVLQWGRNLPVAEI